MSDFWREFSFPSNCDKILEKGRSDTPPYHSVLLERLFDEDDVVVDARELKPDLQTLYVTKVVLHLLTVSLLKPSSLESMLRYVCQEPPPNASDSVKFRFVIRWHCLTQDIRRWRVKSLLRR